MANRKIYIIVAIPIVTVLLFMLFDKAFELISAPSDLSVGLGIVTACVALLILLKSVQFIFKNFSK